MIITIDFRGVRSHSQAHDLLAERLSVPHYYGRNLNALYDVLTERSEPTEIHIFSRRELLEELGDYGAGILEVFRDAARENPALIVLAEL